MKIRIYDTVLQKTSEWLELRRGKTSGSKIKPILTGRTKKPWETYSYELIGQLENEEPLIYKDTFLSAAVEWGNAMEPLAQAEFTKRTGKVIFEVGWVESLDPKLVGRSGASPDGLIRGSELTEWVEIKCLNTANHIKYITENVLPAEYKPQVLNYFMINEDLKVVYFILYDPRVKDKNKQLHIIPILREDHAKEIDILYDKVIEFHDLKDALHAQYKDVKTLTNKQLAKLVG